MEIETILTILMSYDIILSMLVYLFLSKKLLLLKAIHSLLYFLKYIFVSKLVRNIGIAVFTDIAVITGLAVIAGIAEFTHHRHLNLRIYNSWLLPHITIQPLQYHWHQYVQIRTELGIRLCKS